MRRQNDWLSGFRDRWVIVGGIIVCGLLLTFCGLFLVLTAPSGKGEAPQGVLLTIVPPDISPTPAVTATNNSVTPVSVATATLPAGTIGVGSYVQISGVGNDGLRLRKDPGLQSTPLFLGWEAEVFQVKDGPSEADGYTWWLLEAPYDANRSGWAASNYLEWVQNP